MRPRRTTVDRDIKVFKAVEAMAACNRNRKMFLIKYLKIKKNVENPNKKIINKKKQVPYCRYCGLMV